MLSGPQYLGQWHCRSRSRHYALLRDCTKRCVYAPAETFNAGPPRGSITAGPQLCVEKTPTAESTAGQTDEDGTLPYEAIGAVVNRYVDDKEL